MSLARCLCHLGFQAGFCSDTVAPGWMSRAKMSVTSKLKDWIQTQKDNSVSLIAEKMLRKQLEPYGRLVGFSLNSRENRASVKVLLNGEVEPITVDIQQYILSRDASGSYVTVSSARASREWITTLLHHFLIGKRIDIPEKYAGYAKMLL
jgi:hypothetical protein